MPRSVLFSESTARGVMSKPCIVAMHCSAAYDNLRELRLRLAAGLGTSAPWHHGLYPDTTELAVFDASSVGLGPNTLRPNLKHGPAFINSSAGPAALARAPSKQEA